MFDIVRIEGTILLKIGKHIENLSVHAKLMQEKIIKRYIINPKGQT